ncbi:MAG: terpene synthase family protein [Myxococcota bacterium]
MALLTELNELDAAALADRIAAWSDGALGARHDALASVAAAYTRACAPPAPTARSLDVVGRLIQVFLWVDDLAVDPRSTVATDAFDRWRTDAAPERSTAPEVSAHLDDALRAYLDARARELGGPLSLDEHWAVRRHTIFLEPFYDGWAICTGITPPTLRTLLQARALTTDVVILENDLASVGRDAAGGLAPDDLNLVRATSTASGASVDEAIDLLVEQHERLVRRLQGELAGRTGDDAVYATLLRGIVVGNMRCLRVLRARYPGASEVLRRLSVPG